MKYLTIFFLTLGVSLGAVFGLSGSVILSVGEYLSIEQVVLKQQAASRSGKICLYGSAIRHTTTLYKETMYRRIKPDLLILGSSRVMQFRQDVFSSPIVNAGGAGGSIGNLYHFLKRNLSVHKPKHIIIGVDFWWFNEEFDKVENLNFVPPSFKNAQSRLNNFLLPLKWIHEGKISLGRLWEYAENCHYGAQAATGGDGFGPNGSYYYNSLVFGLKPSRSFKFEDTLGRIHDGRNRFQYGESVSALHYENFIQVVQLLRESGVSFSILLPPVAKVAYDAMKAQGAKYGYVWELERRLAEDFGAISFIDPILVSGTDCEFVDGFHGGDIVYARIIEALATRHPALTQIINQREIRRVSALSGRVYEGEFRFIKGAEEVDFLRLGCRKGRASKE